jgi:hypothetical protein
MPSLLISYLALVSYMVHYSIQLCAHAIISIALLLFIIWVSAPYDYLHVPSFELPMIIFTCHYLISCLARGSFGFLSMSSVDISLH